MHSSILSSRRRLAAHVTGISRRVVSLACVTLLATASAAAEDNQPELPEWKQVQQSIDEHFGKIRDLR